MANPADEAKRGNLPPYISFKTLTGFLQKLKETTVPGRVDGSVLRSYAGSVARQLILALKYLKLIESNGNKTARLEQLAAAYGTPDWKAAIGELMGEAYVPVVSNLDLDSGTRQQLMEAFRAAGADGVVLDRAIAFYLSGLKEAGLTFSPHFNDKPRRAKSNGPRTKKKVDEPRKGDDDELSEIEEAELAEQVKFKLAVPGKAAATIIVPADLTSDDWEMISLMMKAYVARLEKTAK